MQELVEQNFNYVSDFKFPEHAFPLIRVSSSGVVLILADSLPQCNSEQNWRICSMMVLLLEFNLARIGSFVMLSFLLLGS
jgi:hypothetical protein